MIFKSNSSVSKHIFTEWAFALGTILVIALVDYRVPKVSLSNSVYYIASAILLFHVLIDLFTVRVERIELDSQAREFVVYYTKFIFLKDELAIPYKRLRLLLLAANTARPQLHIMVEQKAIFHANWKKDRFDAETLNKLTQFAQAEQIVVKLSGR